MAVSQQMRHGFVRRMVVLAGGVLAWLKLLIVGTICWWV